MEDIISKKPDAVGYLVCKENTHKKNWKDDLIKHKKEFILDNTKTILYASLHKETIKADFVILDECHGLTLKRIKALKKILQKNVQIIFLSATIPDVKKSMIIRLCRKVHFYTIDLNKAFELKLLPVPTLIVHRLHLKERRMFGEKEWNYVVRKPKNESTVVKYCAHKDLKKTIKLSKKDWGITCLGSEKEYYEQATSQMDYYERLSSNYTLPIEVREGCRNKYLNIATVRKRFLAEVKTDRVANLVKDFRKLNNRFICFTGSVVQANTIGAKSAVHSKNTKELNQELIDCFNREECSELFAVNMLRESVNLTNIEKGIITQLDSGVGSFFQMLGRTLRHKVPEMHLFVIQNTQDVKYFNRSMKNFNHEYLRYRDYDDNL